MVCSREPPGLDVPFLDIDSENARDELLGLLRESRLFLPELHFPLFAVLQVELDALELAVDGLWNLDDSITQSVGGLFEQILIFIAFPSFGLA